MKSETIPMRYHLYRDDIDLQADEMEAFKRFRVRAYPFLPCKQFLFLTWQSAARALQR